MLLYAYQHTDQIALLAADEPIRSLTDEYQLLFVSSGKGELTIDGDKHILQAGSLYFINYGSMAEIKSLAHTDLHLYRLAFDIINKAAGQRSEASLSFYAEPLLPDGEVATESLLQINTIFKQLCASEEKQHEHKVLEQQKYLYELLQLLLNDPVQTMPANSAPAEHRRRIAQVLRYMQQHYNSSISRDEMAGLAGFHPRFFTKIFKEETGSTFINFLTSLRIKKAQELLLLSNLSLDAIAAQVGYTNGMYLSRIFKQYIGTAPTQYAKQIKRIVIYDMVGYLLALGIKPVGASYFYDLTGLGLLQDELTDVIDVGRADVDTVIALNPELIIVPKWLQSELIGRLQQIAPTYIVPYGNPFKRFFQLAELLDRRHEAERFLAIYKQRATEVKDRIATVIQPNETVGLYELSEQHIWVFNQFHGRGGYNLYEGLSLDPPLNVQKNVIGKGQILRLELEQLPDYCADHMIICFRFTDEGYTHARQLLRHPVWQQIAAFHKKQLYFIDRRIFHPSDVLSLYKQLDLQERMFLEHKPEDVFLCMK